MTLTARYDLKDRLPEPPKLTQCNECGLSKPDTEYYKRYPETCSVCIDEDQDKNSHYQECSDLQWEYIQDEERKKWRVL